MIRTLGSTDRSATVTDQEQLKREARRALSQARYIHWPNTLEAQRQRKDADRQRRLDAIEAAQQAVDERERQYREQEKREAIGRANRLLYQENDRVKTFRSSMLSAKTFYERDAQAVFKDEFKKRQEQFDKIHEAQIKASIEKSLAREQREVAAREALAREASRIRMEQLRDLQTRHSAERLDELREGIATREAAKAALLEEEAIEARRREAQREHAAHYARANAEAKRMKEERAQLEAMEDAQIAQHAANKDAVQAARKAQEEERRRARQAHFDGLIARQSAALENIKKQEQARLDSQLAAMEKQREEKEKAISDHRAKLQRDLVRGRQLQVVRQAEELARKAEIEKMMSEEWTRMNTMLEERELEAERREKERARQLQVERIAQMRERQQREVNERAETLAEAARARRAQEGEDSIFQAYAQHYINEYDRVGIPTVPMKVTLRNIERNQNRLQPLS